MATPTVGNSSPDTDNGLYLDLGLSIDQDSFDRAHENLKKLADFSDKRFSLGLPDMSKFVTGLNQGWELAGKLVKLFKQLEQFSASSAVNATNMKRELGETVKQFNALKNMDANLFLQGKGITSGTFEATSYALQQDYAQLMKLGKLNEQNVITMSEASQYLNKKGFRTQFDTEDQINAQYKSSTPFELQKKMMDTVLVPLARLAAKGDQEAQLLLSNLPYFDQSTKQFAVQYAARGRKGKMSDYLLTTYYTGKEKDLEQLGWITGDNQMRSAMHKANLLSAAGAAVSTAYNWLMGTGIPDLLSEAMADKLYAFAGIDSARTNTTVRSKRKYETARTSSRSGKGAFFEATNKVRGANSAGVVEGEETEYRRAIAYAIELEEQAKKAGRSLDALEQMSISISAGDAMDRGNISGKVTQDYLTFAALLSYGKDRGLSYADYLAMDKGSLMVGDKKVQKSFADRFFETEIMMGRDGMDAYLHMRRIAEKAKTYDEFELLNKNKVDSGEVSRDTLQKIYEMYHGGNVLREGSGGYVVKDEDIGTIAKAMMRARKAWPWSKENAINRFAKSFNIDREKDPNNILLVALDQIIAKELTEPQTEQFLRDYIMREARSKLGRDYETQFGENYENFGERLTDRQNRELYEKYMMLDFVSQQDDDYKKKHLDRNGNIRKGSRNTILEDMLKEKLAILTDGDLSNGEFSSLTGANFFNVLTQSGLPMEVAMQMAANRIQELAGVGAAPFLNLDRTKKVDPNGQARLETEQIGEEIHLILRLQNTDKTYQRQDMGAVDVDLTSALSSTGRR